MSLETFGAGISGSTIINNVKYKWVETSWSNNRGITFNPGSHIYQFSPNPHNDPWYNKNQVKFYNAAVDKVAEQGNRDKWTTNNWPNQIQNVVVHNITYTLNVR